MPHATASIVSELRTATTAARPRMRNKYSRPTVMKMHVMHACMQCVFAPTAICLYFNLKPVVISSARVSVSVKNRTCAPCQHVYTGLCKERAELAPRPSALHAPVTRELCALRENLPPPPSS